MVLYHKSIKFKVNFYTNTFVEGISTVIAKAELCLMDSIFLVKIVIKSFIVSNIAVIEIDLTKDL